MPRNVDVPGRYKKHRAVNFRKHYPALFPRPINKQYVCKEKDNLPWNSAKQIENNMLKSACLIFIITDTCVSHFKLTESFESFIYIYFYLFFFLLFLLSVFYVIEY